MNDPDALSDTIFSNFKIIDVSLKVVPGVEKVNSTYVWGNQIRKFQIRQFIAPGPHFMYWVEAETHVGTHVELPAHIIDDGKSATEMPLDVFFGQAIVLKFDFLQPQEGKRSYILPAHLEQVKEDDIVLMWSPYKGRQTPSISLEAGELLAKKPIKMLGIQNVGAPDDVHHILLGRKTRPIPIIEQLDHLGDINRERVFFIGFPLRVAHLDSSWIRAVVLEPIA